jgi:hypothetical protein
VRLVYLRHPADAQEGAYLVDAPENRAGGEDRGGREPGWCRSRP